MALSITLWLNQLMYSSKQRLVSISAISLSFFLLIKAASAQAFFTLILLLSFLILLKFIKKFNPKQAALVAVLLIFVFIPTYIGVTENLESIFGVFGKDTTLTGRTEFWPQMFEALEKRPILGYGVEGFWQAWRGEQNPAGHIIISGGFAPPNGHSGFLDLAMELGWFGLGLFAFSFVFNVSRAIRFWWQSTLVESMLPLLLLTYIFSANISETQLFLSNYIWFFYVIVAVRLNLRAEKQPLPNITNFN